jgi:hypothetical protein
MSRMLKTTVYLTPALKARLETAARARGQSEADVIREAISTFTAGERPRPRLPLVRGPAGTTDLAERVDEMLAAGFGRW